MYHLISTNVVISWVLQPFPIYPQLLRKYMSWTLQLFATLFTHGRPSHTHSELLTSKSCWRDNGHFSSAHLFKSQTVEEHGSCSGSCCFKTCKTSFNQDRLNEIHFDPPPPVTIFFWLFGKMSNYSCMCRAFLLKCTTSDFIKNKEIHFLKVW